MRRLIAILLLSAATSPAWADSDFEIDCTVGCRAAFHDAVQDVAAALHYKQLAPAEATGLLGFGIGAIASYVPTKNDSAWKTLTGSSVDAVGMVGGALSKGLPFGIDVAGFYSGIPGTGASAYGAEVRYAFLEGGVATPAVAVGVNYTTTSGIDDFDYDAWGVDATVSKGFAFLTPYAGAGYVSAKATPNGALKNSIGLENETVDTGRFFVGLRISMLLFELTPEYERFGDNNVYNLRLGLSF